MQFTDSSLAQLFNLVHLWSHMLRGAVFVNDICKYGPRHVEMIMSFKIIVKSTGNLYSLCKCITGFQGGCLSV